MFLCCTNPKDEGETLKDTNKGPDKKPPAEKTKRHWWTRLIAYIKAKRDERKARKQQETPADRSARITAIATMWIAFFTLVLAAIAAYQFIILRGQLNVMHKDLRAWISVEQKVNQASATVDAPLATVLIYKNTGKTPASPIAGNFYIEIVPNGEAPHFGATAPVAHNAFFSGMLLPNSPQEIIVTRMRFKSGGQTEAVPFTETEKNAIVRGDAWFAIHGDISYRDTFQIAHWIKFCFWGGGAPIVYGAQYCTAYNSIDPD